MALENLPEGIQAQVTSTSEALSQFYAQGRWEPGEEVDHDAIAEEALGEALMLVALLKAKW